MAHPHASAVVRRLDGAPFMRAAALAARTRAEAPESGAGRRRPDRRRRSPVTDDERIARLQRMAYGADTPDPVRARAVAELAELAETRGGRTETADAGRLDGVPASHVAASGEEDEAGAGRDTSPDDPTSSPVVTGTRSRIPRGPVLLVVAGLLVGAAVGVAMSRVAPADSDPATADVAPTAPAFGSGEPGTPVDETLLPPLFERLPPVADTGPLDQALGGIDPASVRLLATRADGPAAYLARTSEGSDVCLILLVVSHGPAQSTCTAGGLMPAGGLRIRYASPTEGFVAATLNAAGTITLGRDAGR